MKARFSRGTDAYRNVQTTTSAPYADSIQLTQMLFGALLESLAEAEGHISREHFEKKAYCLSRANKILLGLQSSLDFNKGKELAFNLSDIYDYSMRRLLIASIKNDVAGVQEIRGLISEIDSAWQVLPSILSSQSMPLAS
jgi:flagellar protein FliS